MLYNYQNNNSIFGVAMKNTLKKQTNSLIAHYQRAYINYFALFEKSGIERERAWLERQELKYRKWHSFWYFLRFLFTGKD
jgi:hypothetical protein